MVFFHFWGIENNHVQQGILCEPQAQLYRFEPHDHHHDHGPTSIPPQATAVTTGK